MLLQPTGRVAPELANLRHGLTLAHANMNKVDRMKEVRPREAPESPLPWRQGSWMPSSEEASEKVQSRWMDNTRSGSWGISERRGPSGRTSPCESLAELALRHAGGEARLASTETERYSEQAALRGLTKAQNVDPTLYSTAQEFAPAAWVQSEESTVYDSYPAHMLDEAAVFCEKFHFRSNYHHEEYCAANAMESERLLFISKEPKFATLRETSKLRGLDEKPRGLDENQAYDYKAAENRVRLHLHLSPCSSKASDDEVDHVMSDHSLNSGLGSRGQGRHRSAVVAPAAAPHSSELTEVLRDGEHLPTDRRMFMAGGRMHEDAEARLEQSSLDELHALQQQLVAATWQMAGGHGKPDQQGLATARDWQQH